MLGERKNERENETGLQGIWRAMRKLSAVPGNFVPGNSLEWMRVILAKLQIKGEKERGLAFFSNQARLLVVGREQQPNHKIFHLPFVQPVRWAGVMVVQTLWKRLTNDWSKLRSMPQEGTQV